MSGCISVDDRLPEPEKNVLMWFVTEPDPRASAFIIGQFSSYKPDKIWSCGMYRDRKNISHWMPLPDPPEAES